MLAMMEQSERVMGKDDATPDEAYLFPNGLAGFVEDRRFAIMYPGHGDCVCLQSIDNIEVAFIMTPWDSERLGLPPALGAEEMKLLDLHPGDVPVWMLVLNPFVDGEWVTANLRAPIVVNERPRLAIQYIRNEEQELRFPWMRQPKPAEDDAAA
ncbi:MAG: flagellar assembly protein FliW [Mariprofundales bacterium]|nr:flagellar assembly protein FliW [Mariprofundales bacterium]